MRDRVQWDPLYCSALLLHLATACITHACLRPPAGLEQAPVLGSEISKAYASREHPLQAQL